MLSREERQTEPSQPSEKDRQRGVELNGVQWIIVPVEHDFCDSTPCLSIAHFPTFDKICLFCPEVDQQRAKAGKCTLISPLASY
jgi:hypothetical protein